jgi:hypothetical protein
MSATRLPRSAATDTGTQQQQLPQTKFSMQKLSLDTAVAPLLRKPRAPFARSERKRAFACASYYSECFLNGIPPLDADTAALDAQTRYNKWWVGSNFTKYRETEPTEKRRKLEPERSPTNEQMDTVVIPNENDATMVGRPPRANFSQEISQCIDIRELGIQEEYKSQEIQLVKGAMITELNANGGDTSSPNFLACLDILKSFYAYRGWDARWTGTTSPPFAFDGTWLTMSKPTYSECQGLSEDGDYVYSLGRLAFDMFRPTNLICSLQGVYNTVGLPHESEKNRPRSCPFRLHNAVNVKPGSPSVRNYE